MKFVKLLIVLWIFVSKILLNLYEVSHGMMRGKQKGKADDTDNAMMDFRWWIREGKE